MRRTRATVAVARALLESPDALHWGYALTRESGVPSGQLYPLIGRMVRNGWLSAEPRAVGQGFRPPRRYYRVTSEGVAALRELVAD